MPLRRHKSITRGQCSGGRPTRRGALPRRRAGRRGGERSPSGVLGRVRERAFYFQFRPDRLILRPLVHRSCFASGSRPGNHMAAVNLHHVVSLVIEDFRRIREREADNPIGESP